MKVYIEKQLNGKYSVIEAKLYKQPITTKKVFLGGISIFGNKLDDHTIELTHFTHKYRHGEALSSTMGYEDCLKFVVENDFKVCNISCHGSFYTELDSRFYRK